MEGDYIIGLKQGKQSISLEPGGQFELSGAPLETLYQTCAEGRYEIMRNYMPKVGILGVDMMFRTYTVQVNLDFSSEVDMIRKFCAGLALQPSWWTRVVDKEDYENTVKLQVTTTATTQNDAGGRLLSNLNKSIEEERCKDAKFLPDHAGAGLAVKKWQTLEGLSGMDYSSSGIGSNDNTQTNIPTRPSGFADSFTSSDGH